MLEEKGHVWAFVLCKYEQGCKSQEEYPWYLLEFAAPNTELYLGQEFSAHFWGACFLVWFFCFGL